MNTTEEFLRAVGEFSPEPPVNHIYRIYYDAGTGEITKQTHNEISGTDPFVELGLSEYNAVKHILNERMIVDGKIVPRPKKKIVPPLKRSQRGFATLRNNMIFVADSSVKEIEYWEKND